MAMSEMSVGYGEDYSLPLRWVSVASIILGTCTPVSEPCFTKVPEGQSLCTFSLQVLELGPYELLLHERILTSL